jgi:hypothetical protein
MYDIELELRIPRVGVRVPELPAADGDPRGRLTRLASINGRGLMLIKQWDQHKNDPAILLDIMALLLPDLAAEDVRQLSTGTMLQLLEMAMQSADDLRKRVVTARPPRRRAAKG